MKKRDDDANLSCSFCGKSQREVKKLIAGPTVYICDECIELCNDIIAEEYGQDESPTPSSRVPKPREILKLRERMNEILAEHTGKPLAQIAADTERDYHMSGDEARAYGLVDKVVRERSDTAGPNGPTGAKHISGGGSRS